jgi:hypothetical protein
MKRRPSGILEAVKSMMISIAIHLRMVTAWSTGALNYLAESGLPEAFEVLEEVAPVEFQAPEAAITVAVKESIERMTAIEV